MTTRKRSAAAPAQSEAPPQIVARNLVKTYKLGGSVIGALQGVSVEVARGEYLAVTGASGSGKSTFMNLIGALDTPTSGSLAFEGRELSRLGSDQLALYRNEKVGFVFQTFNLLPRMTALRNVELPLIYNGVAARAARASLEAMRRGLRTGPSTAERALGRPAPAGGHRPGAHQQPVDHPRRRAHGQLDSKTGDEIMAMFQQLNDDGRDHHPRHARARHRPVRAHGRDPRRPRLARRAGGGPPGPGGGGLRVNVSEGFRQSFETITHNKLRTFLTMLGMNIGVGSVIAGWRSA